MNLCELGNSSGLKRAAGLWPQVMLTSLIIFGGVGFEKGNPSANSFMDVPLMQPVLSSQGIF